MTHYLEANRTQVRQFRRPRRQTPTGLIVVHTAESMLDTVGPDTGAESVAKFMLTRDSYGSYHRLVDSDSIVDLVGFGAEAYGDGTGSNPFAIHVSAACRTTDWGSMSVERRDAFVRNLAKAAAEAARWLRREHQVVVPALRVTRAESDDGRPGFISHGERDPGRRTDPGSGFPWAAFLDAFAEEFPLSRPAPAKPRVADKNQKARRRLLALEKAERAAGRPRVAGWLKSLRLSKRPNRK